MTHLGVNEDQLCRQEVEGDWDEEKNAPILSWAASYYGEIWDSVKFMRTPAQFIEAMRVRPTFEKGVGGLPSGAGVCPTRKELCSMSANRCSQRRHFMSCHCLNRALSTATGRAACHCVYPELGLQTPAALSKIWQPLRTPTSSDTYIPA